MKKSVKAIILYGVFLILVGVIGYASNPEKAKTALMSGGLFGTLSIFLGVLAARGWAMSIPVTLGLAGFLGIVFIWRSAVSWMAFFSGQPEKLTAAILITLMLAGSLLLIGLLLRKRRQIADGDPRKLQASS